MPATASMVAASTGCLCRGTPIGAIRLVAGMVADASAQGSGCPRRSATSATACRALTSSAAPIQRLAAGNTLEEAITAGLPRAGRARCLCPVVGTIACNAPRSTLRASTIRSSPHHDRRACRGRPRCRRARRHQRPRHPGGNGRQLATPRRAVGASILALGCHLEPRISGIARPGRTQSGAGAGLHAEAGGEASGAVDAQQALARRGDDREPAYLRPAAGRQRVASDFTDRSTGDVRDDVVALDRAAARQGLEMIVTMHADPTSASRWRGSSCPACATTRVAMRPAGSTTCRSNWAGSNGRRTESGARPFRSSL